MQAMTTCLDFSPDFLALSAHEAVACCALPVAVASLSNLLHFYASGKAMPTSEVIVLRTLLTILTQEPNSEEEVLKYMKRAQTRTAELGPDHFFGKGEVGKRERNWFAVNSWNFGTRTGKDNKYELCAAFFRLASEFYRVMVDGEVQESSVMVCKSLISTVSGMIAAEKQRKTALVDTEVKQALDLLDRAGKVLPHFIKLNQQSPFISFLLHQNRIHRHFYLGICMAVWYSHFNASYQETMFGFEFDSLFLSCCITIEFIDVFI